MSATPALDVLPKMVDANDILRANMSELNKVIVAADVRTIADKCEEKELITASTKETISSNSTGRPDSDRASLLIDTIRRSLAVDPDGALDEFLCIVFSMGGRGGQTIAKRIAKEYGKPLRTFSNQVKQYKTNTTNSQPKLRDLVLDLKALLHWEVFALHLPEVDKTMVTRVKLENRDDIEGQKRILLEGWLRADPSASWECVVKALDTVNENVLANQVRITRCGIDTSKSSSQVTSATSINSSNQLDSKLLFKKSPIIEDVLEVLTSECDNEKFRNALNIPVNGDLKEAITVWINDEPSEVTWLNLLQAVKMSSRQTARIIATSYLRRPDVYMRYINTVDFESLNDLGI